MDRFDWEWGAKALLRSVIHEYGEEIEGLKGRCLSIGIDAAEKVLLSVPLRVLYPEGNIDQEAIR
jgi:hypothetical protein